MSVKYAHIIVKKRIYKVLKIDECANGSLERGNRAGHKDFEVWLVNLTADLVQQGYSVSVERHDTGT